MLSRITLRGFRSIRDIDLDLRPLNVLIGANGAGKSNLLSFFRFLGYLRTGKLQGYVGTVGSAQTLLLQGARHTPVMTLSLEFEVSSGRACYEAALAHAAGDTLIFSHERVGHGFAGQPVHWEDLGAGHRESRLVESRDATGFVGRTVNTVLWNLERCTWYHFHDTSTDAKIRGRAWVEDHAYLRSDGSNLAAYLFALKQSEPQTYAKIRAAVQQIAPEFDDFQLAPSALSSGHVLLNWTEQRLDYLFGPHQMSDGLLRAVGLVTALTPPPSHRRVLITLDEPELGLHPFAINLIAGLLRSASIHTQFIISTQSVSFVNQWTPEELVIVERADHASVFKRLDSATLVDWLSDYSLGELWEKNVLGGRPARS